MASTGNLAGGSSRRKWRNLFAVAATALTLTGAVGLAAAAHAGEGRSCSTLPNGTCPAESSPGACPENPAARPAGVECEDLRNHFIGRQSSFPREVYRGDSRPPAEAFARGFFSRGTNYDVRAHLHGGAQASHSGWISTSASLRTSEDFMRSAGVAGLADNVNRGFCSHGGSWATPIPGLGNLIMGICQGQTLISRSFVYIIDPTVARNAIYIPDQLGDTTDASLRRMFSQQEWAYAYHIPSSAIMGVRIYRTQAPRLGTGFDSRRITTTFENFVPNPHYLNRDPGTHRYQPNLDTAARFLAVTWLNIALADHKYPRG